jgi:disulfide bond formation protein DsbB
MHNLFESLMPFLFAILLISCFLGFILMARLHRLLHTRQPNVYESLGSPTLFLNNNIKNGWAMQRFLLGGHFQQVNDPVALRFCRFMRAYTFCYLAFFAGFVVVGLFSIHLSSKR